MAAHAEPEYRRIPIVPKVSLNKMANVLKERERETLNSTINGGCNDDEKKSHLSRSPEKHVRGRRCRRKIC